MTGLILRDAARIQFQDAERINRKQLRADEPPFHPLYSGEDVERTFRLFKPVPYMSRSQWRRTFRRVLSSRTHARLGELAIARGREWRAPHGCILRRSGPEGCTHSARCGALSQADLVFLESTYGDRDHRPFDETVREFIAILQHAVAREARCWSPPSPWDERSC